MPSYPTMKQLLKDISEFIISFINTLREFVGGFKNHIPFDTNPDDAEPLV